MSEIFDREYYRGALRKIWGHKLISLCDLAREIGIQFNTLKKIMDEDSEPISYKTMRAIRDYVERNGDRDGL